MYPVYNKFYYKPLPDCVEVQKSPIEGFGLFAVDNIDNEFDLGMSHIKVPIIQGYVRTSIGGFLNHSEDSKLLRMWQRIGGILLPIDNMNPDNLYFNSAKKALETKALYKEHYPDDPNPYRYVSNKSIYDADTVKELRS